MLPTTTHEVGMWLLPLAPKTKLSLFLELLLNLITSIWPSHGIDVRIWLHPGWALCLDFYSPKHYMNGEGFWHLEQFKESLLSRRSLAHLWFANEGRHSQSRRFNHFLVLYEVKNHLWSHFPNGTHATNHTSAVLQFYIAL